MSLLESFLRHASSNWHRAYFLVIAFAFREILRECLSRPTLVVEADAQVNVIAAIASHESVLDLLSNSCETNHELPDEWMAF